MFDWFDKPEKEASDNSDDSEHQHNYEQVDSLTCDTLDTKIGKPRRRKYYERQTLECSCGDEVTRREDIAYVWIEDGEVKVKEL